jgi:hypothetical protein
LKRAVIGQQLESQVIRKKKHDDFDTYSLTVAHVAHLPPPVLVLSVAFRLHGIFQILKLYTVRAVVKGFNKKRSLWT